MTDLGDEGALAAGETPGGLPWQLTVRLDGKQREINLLVVGSHGGGITGPQLSPEQMIGICMLGGAPDRCQHIVGELARTVDHASICLDDDSEVDAVIVRSNLGEVDYFVAFVPWEREVMEARAFDHLGRVLAVDKRSNIEFWRKWRLRRTKEWPAPAQAPPASDG